MVLVSSIERERRKIKVGGATAATEERSDNGANVGSDSGMAATERDDGGASKWSDDGATVTPAAENEGW
ncbi:uncharacterized protein DS421_12g375480 [Arachis hypogaea]|nr:uncharacterized protein DS421_12g375480 [Arachis hypogaea]